MREKDSAAITRRSMLKIGSGAFAGAVISSGAVSGFAQEQAVKAFVNWENPYRDIRGFGYQPSYEATGYSIWSQFRPEK